MTSPRRSSVRPALVRLGAAALTVLFGVVAPVGAQSTEGTLRGKKGNDRLNGGANGDRLWGGPGGDRCHGGRGEDWQQGCEA